MKKKLTGLILGLTMLFNMSVISVYSSSENYDAERLEKAKNLLEVTEIMELPDDEGQYMQTITRAEFAVYLANAFGVDSSQKDTDRYYIDVPMDHWALSSINFLYKRGILTMNESRTFLPDQTITKDEAYKMAVEAVGYGDYADYQGGFPAGYRRAADRIEISEGISGTEELTIADTAILLANTLVTPNLEGFVYSEDSVTYTNEYTATILEIYHNIYIIDAQVTGAPGISIAGFDNIPAGEIMLGNKFYYCSIANLYDYIGYSVRAYCKKADRNDESGEIVLIEDIGETKKRTVSSKDFIGFDSSEYNLEYWEGEARRSISLAKGITVVKNGASSNNDIDSVFNINKGRLEFLDTDGDGVFDCALVWEYTNLMVSYVDYEEQVIYDKLNAATKLKYGLTEIDVLRIFDEKGKQTQSLDIKPNTLLTIYKSENYLEIHICPEGKTETIVAYNETGVDGPYAELADSSGNKHIASFDADYMTDNSESVSVGVTGVFYYDLYGKIAYIDKNRKDNIRFGFIVDYREDGIFSPTVQLKLLTEDNACSVLNCNDTVEIDGEAEDNSNDIFSALRLGKNSISGQVIAYKQNSEGKIIAIDTVNKGTSEVTSLTLTASAEEKRFTYASRNFGPLTLIGTNTVCFGVPAEANISTAKEDDFLVLPISWFESDMFYEVETYKLETESGYEDVLVCRDNFEQAKTVKSMFVVEEIYEVLNENGVGVECIDGYMNGIKYTYRVHKGKSLADKGIGSGDIIFPILDAQGDISDCTAFYDYSGRQLSDLWSASNEYNTYYNSNYMAYGNVLSTKDGVIKIGRTSLNTIDIVAPCDNIPITLCEEIEGKFVCSMGRPEDIVGYDVSETDYSRIFIKMNYGAVKEIVIYK